MRRMDAAAAHLVGAEQVEHVARAARPGSVRVTLPPLGYAFCASEAGR